MEHFFKNLESQGILRDEMASLGWGLWLFSPEGLNLGYIDEYHLRMLADEIERRNKPFWDEYEEYCKNQPQHDPDVDEFTFLEPESVKNSS